MMPGQHGAAEIVEAAVTCLAEIVLPVRLRLVMAVVDDRGAVATRTAHASWPPALTQQFEAFRLVQECREVDQFRYSHGKKLVLVAQRCFPSIRPDTLDDRHPAHGRHPETLQEPPGFAKAPHN